MSDGHGLENIDTRLLPESRDDDVDRTYPDVKASHNSAAGNLTDTFNRSNTGNRSVDGNSSDTGNATDAVNQSDTSHENSTGHKNEAGHDTAVSSWVPDEVQVAPSVALNNTTYRQNDNETLSDVAASDAVTVDVDDNELSALGNVINTNPLDEYPNHAIVRTNASQEIGWTNAPSDGNSQQDYIALDDVTESDEANLHIPSQDGLDYEWKSNKQHLAANMGQIAELVRTVLL